MDAMEDEPTPHTLTVRTRQDAGPYLEVKISDSGNGIPSDKPESIFDAFVTTKPQGTGLGLPIARTILESYADDISTKNSASRRNFLVSVAAERDVGRVQARTSIDRKDTHWEQRKLKGDQ